MVENMKNSTFWYQTDAGWVIFKVNPGGSVNNTFGGILGQYEDTRSFFTKDAQSASIVKPCSQTTTTLSK